MYVVSKVVLAVIGPFELVWLRYVVALMTLGLVGVVTKQSWHIEKRHIPIIILMGIVGYFISIWAQFAGTKLSSAQMGAVITSATPAFMVFFARLLLKEQITLGKAVSVSLATIGVLFIVGIGDMGSTFQLGGVILIIAALTWALLSVLVKLIPAEYSQLVVTTYAIFTAAAVMTPFAVSKLTSETILSLGTWTIGGGVLYLGIVSTAGAFYFWNKGLQMVEAGRGSLYFFFQPLVGTLLGWLLLDEQVGITFWLGAGLILGGVLLVFRE
jgi:drug/metabolite transporter (DMT)-like permease